MSDTNPEIPAQNPPAPTPPPAHDAPASGAPASGAPAAQPAPPAGAYPPAGYGAAPQAPYGAVPTYGNAPAYGVAPGYPAAPGYAAAPGYGAYPAAPATNTLAIVSLISSLVGFFLIPIIGQIVGIITGHMALNRLKTSGENGRGLALAGTIIGWVTLGLGILAIIAFIAFFVPLMATQSYRYNS